ncbi:TPA: RHS repeat-associated core domain-containing protein [Burkholderia vietnamiensis]|nr:RHS repeat-associated core domain-containing protein [Burkholderia vietnamiensis]HDR9360439.1 RHS repeat-associated core domain-containing protein [Burkholderia vietnamiensis]
MRYNRYRYYDPASGRFISKDPIGPAGGINGYQYAPNPVGWVDPLGLARCPCDCEKVLANMRENGRAYASTHIGSGHLKTPDAKSKSGASTITRRVLTLRCSG